MTRNWVARGVCLVLAMVSLAGCVIVPARPYYRPAPVYYYR